MAFPLYIMVSRTGGSGKPNWQKKNNKNIKDNVLDRHWNGLTMRASDFKELLFQKTREKNTLNAKVPESFAQLLVQSGVDHRVVRPRVASFHPRI